MKSFKKFVAEVAQPKSKEEKNFKDQHSYEVVNHPVADPAQHTGDIGAPGLPKAKAKRKADQEGDANYDKTYSKKDDDGVKLESKEMATRAALDKASDSSKEGKKAVSLKKAPWDKTEALVGGQKKLDHDKDGDIDGLDFAALRAKKKKKNEETEESAELDELSKKTLGSYVKKASRDVANRSADNARDYAKDNRPVGMNKKGIKNWKREIGIDKAVDKLAKESIEETTSSALKRAVTQTGPDGKTRTVMKKLRSDKTDNRGQDSIQTRESVELDEAVSFKKGPVKLKDGKQIMVSAQDAALLNKMFKDLSPANQKQMEKVAMMDKAGFDEIVGFAREAL